MMNKKLFILAALMSFVMAGRSQEYLSSFGDEPESKYWQHRIVSNDNVATLPFFDDFTGTGNSPSEMRWQSPCVFTNSGFPFKPVNYRAATLDLIDGTGAVYTNGSSNPFIADSLMSVAIRLNSVDGQALTPADSVYLSFYYQAGGYGNAPDENDSLVLCLGYGYEEYDTIDGVVYIYEKTAWKHVWSIAGEESDSTFKKVMIPVKDPCYFTERFYVLFYNYGTLPTVMYPNDRSNMDIWNIDFVYLDAGRSVLKEDTYPKVSLTGLEPKFLKRYSSMPYSHYKETSPDVTMNYLYNMSVSNLDSMAHEVRYHCTVEDRNTGDVYSVNDTNFVSHEYSYLGVEDFNVRIKNFRFPDNQQYDSATFVIRQYVEVVDQYGEIVAGDSMVSRQGFYNFYAYDDGTPECGYGLAPDDTYFATQFNVSSPEKLYGVQILFNRIFTVNPTSPSYRFFDVYVWGNNDGKPGEVIYKLENQLIEWTDDLYGFTYYKFEKPIQVSGTFYVGIRQQEKVSINIGFDTSRDNSKYNFYKTDADWKNSSFSGSLMIRPMAGKEYFIGVEENQSVTDELVLYPNPVRDVIHIDGLNADDGAELAVFDVTGRKIKTITFSNELNVSDLIDGMYMLRIVKEDGSAVTSRFVVSK